MHRFFEKQFFGLSGKRPRTGAATKKSLDVISSHCSDGRIRAQGVVQGNRKGPGAKVSVE